MRTPEEIKAYKKAWAQRNAEKRNAKWRAAYANRTPEQIAKQLRRSGNTPEKGAVCSARYRSTLSGRVAQLIGQARGRARRKDIEFTLTDDWAIDRLIAGHCEVTGFPFVLEAGDGLQPYNPSIDRVDNSLGYTPDNCRLVISAFNFGKNRWSDDILAGWARAFLKQYDSTH